MKMLMHTIKLGLWGSLAILPAWGAGNLSSNLSGPIAFRKNILCVNNRKKYNVIHTLGLLVMRMQKTLFDFLDEDEDSDKIKNIKKAVIS